MALASRRTVLVLALSAIGLLAARPLQAQLAEETVARFKALEDQIRAYSATLRPEQRVGPGPFADALLVIRKAQLIAAGDAGFLNAMSIEKALFLAESAVEALGTPPVAGPPKAGFQERAYVSEIDGSAEPYFLYVPAGYDPAKSWPLLVFLHGYSARLSVNNWHELMYSPTLQAVCEKEGAILLMPFGRSNTEFMGIGESDVLKTIGFVRDEYNVDPARVILSGASMGGSGAYTIACHQPDRFAAVSAITGRVDYYEWMGVEKSALPRFKQIQMDTDYARGLLPNLQYVPALIFHGEFDETLNIEQSRMMHRMLLEFGQKSEYVEFEGMGHLGTWDMSFEHSSFGRMLREARAPARPMRVQYRTFTLKYPGAYWVRIARFQRWGDVAQVRAEMGEDGIVHIETKNVAALTLGPGLPGNVPNDAVKVVANGKEAPTTLTEGGAIDIVLDGEAIADKTLRKTPALCGPIREAFDGPFTLVYPSGRSEAHEAARRLTVQLVQDWYACAKALPEINADSEVDEDLIASRHLILVGGPEVNCVLARITDRLPVRIADDSYLVGDRRFPRKGNGLWMIYPNPLNPKRYVLIIDGVQWAPEVQPNHKLDFLPDFIVFTAETVKDDTWFPTNRPLCAGYFDGSWQLSKRTTWTDAGDPDAPPEDVP